jgi:dolichol-phosphate mannosyltransferase
MERARNTSKGKRTASGSMPAASSLDPAYAVILPTYNERENLPFVVELVHQAFSSVSLADRYHLVIVDDNSPDGTLQVARALQKLYGEERLTLAPRSGKLGLGTAYRHGLQRAPTACSRIFLFDADLSHNPLAIPAFIACMDKTQADIVTGTRYLGTGGVCGWGWKRKITSSAANLLTQWLLDPGVSDVTGSFRLYRREALEQLLEAVHSRGYVFQMEAMVRATRQFQYHVAEVPIVFVDRMWYGQSKLGYREIVEYLLTLWQLVWLA